MALLALPAPRARRPSTSGPTRPAAPKGKHADAFCFEGDHPVAVLRALRQGAGPRTGSASARRASASTAATATRTSPASSRGPASTSTAPASTSSPGSPTGAPSIATSSSIRERAVFAVGDSLGEGTKPYLPGALPGWKVSQSVSISRFLPEGVSIVRSRGGLPARDRVRARDQRRPPQRLRLSQRGRRRCSRSPARPAASSSRTSSGRRSAAPATPASTARSPTSPSTTTTCGSSTGPGSSPATAAGSPATASHVNATGYAARARPIANQVERC